MFAELSRARRPSLIINHDGRGFARTRGKNAGVAARPVLLSREQPPPSKKNTHRERGGRGTGRSALPPTSRPQKRWVSPQTTQRQDGCLRELLPHSAAGEGDGVSLRSVLIAQGVGRGTQGQGTDPPAPQPCVPRLGNRSLRLAGIQPSVSTPASSPLSFQVFMNINSVRNWVRRRSGRLPGAGGTVSPAVPCFPGQLRVPDSRRRKKLPHF